MITVSFPKDVSRNFRLVVKGHSSEEKGKDIICSSVSSLVQTYLRGIEKHLGAKFTGNFQPGICDLEIEVSCEMLAKFTIVSEIFRDGFLEIAKAYPKQVKLI